MNQEPTAYLEQSAVIPYRFREGQLEILLITSRNSKRWIIPKGIIEPNMNPQDSAAQEALEEAGIKGKVSDIIRGSYTYQKWGSTCRVQIFTLEVDTIYIDWLEASFRKRQWVSLSEAIRLIQEEEVRKILAQLPDYLDQTQ
ncbi:NUDIX hydrolase [Rippkaea orientalis PCC 8801]|uniref:NUDIX hydrolase n=1 Tax=Rippkaea orientalis (strain PCC 8801 / RF-1) TaxID=41431 RepID=B7JYW6_RIPO1|nr:NUDIX hydrolase [Rippkaea orientalis]ACK66043.1 NUDIX hydrolase [Rippkaea orientalis PCC 8801]